ncbi:MAG: cytochrome b/b6 domain-containing protein [Proteobacteria bacterium]|nr:cytochrome b/b6 domain-containing protein [Pseudomonadota bacterium]
METGNFVRRKVYGGIQRFIHAWIGSITAAQVAIGWFGKSMEPGATKLPLIQAHIFLGYGLVVGLAARFVWGIVGPKHARFSAIVHPAVGLSVLRKFRFERSNNFGHDPNASLTYLGLYGALGVSVVSGLVLAAIKYDVGPLASILFDDFSLHELALNFHDAVLYAATGFTVVHIGGMILHENKTGHPIAQAMVSGYQYRYRIPEEENND